MSDSLPRVSLPSLGLNMPLSAVTGCGAPQPVESFRFDPRRVKRSPGGIAGKHAMPSEVDGLTSDDGEGLRVRVALGRVVRRNVCESNQRFVTGRPGGLHLVP